MSTLDQFEKIQHLTANKIEGIWERNTKLPMEFYKYNIITL